jgi:hypothetical protein
MSLQRTSGFLMANLGAEVSRILAAKDRGNTALVRESIDRALKILTEILEIPNMKPRQAEIETLRDVITDVTRPNPIYRVSRKNLSSYFIPFASAVMVRGRQV